MQKRIVSLFVVSLLLGALMLLVACRQEQTQPAPATPAPVATPGPAASAATPAPEVPVELPPPYPIVTDGSVTLRYWMPIDSAALAFITSKAENIAYQLIQERTGINIDFIHPVAGEAQQTFNLMMVSGDLPDIINGGHLYVGGELQGVLDGVFVDLAPYLPTLAPDYWALITSDELLQRMVFSVDGMVPAFYRILENPIPVAHRPVVRTDWIEELGLEFEVGVPKTLDEFEMYFQAILDNMPGVAPFLLPHQTPPHVSNEVWYGAFDILPYFFLDHDGRVAHGFSHPRMRDYLTLMNDWFERGFIHREFAAMEGGQQWAEFTTGQIASITQAVGVTLGRADEAGFPINSTPLPRRYHHSRVHTRIADWPRGGEITVVASCSRYREYAIRFLNFGYTPEGAMIYNFGVEGVTFNIIDGEPVLSDYILNHPVFDAGAANSILRIHFAPNLVTHDPTVFNPVLARDPRAVELRLRWDDDPNVDQAFRIPPIALTAEESERRASIMANVNTLAAEMILRFIMGSEPLDNFDSYVEQLERFGINEAIQITQDAFDRFMGR